MRVAGAPEDEIRERLGYRSLSAVRQVLSRAALKHMRYRERELEKLRDVELARLDALQAIAWVQAEQGSMQAIDRILKIMQHRASLVGLEQARAPSQPGTINTQVLVVGGEDSGHMVDQLQAAAMEVNAVARRAEIVPGTSEAQDIIDVSSD